MKRILFALLFSWLLLPNPTQAASEKINIYLFYGDGCPHCAKEEAFLNKLLSAEPYKSQVIINTYETWHNSKNAQFLAGLGKEYKLDTSGVPLLLIGDRAISGYLNDYTTGANIQSVLDEALGGQCRDIVQAFVNGEEINDSSQTCTSSPELKSIHSSLFGSIDLQKLSLPALTFVVALLDGFNPCAMWVLVFLISILLGMRNRKRMWLLGGVFILVSGLAYFVFLSAWLNFFLFVGFIIWVRLAVAVAALVTGVYYVRDFFVKKEATCKVSDSQKKRKIFERIKDIAKKENIWLALLGIILLAASINLVELLCSAGLPAIYTQILSLSELPTWEYYIYLAFYILIFMLDDIIVFLIAMFTLKMRGINSKYARWSGLIGGVIMLLVGLLLIFKPGWLMFS
jgi:hypothetical protein